MNKDIKLFIADVDGTIRHFNKEIPGEATISAFEKMHEQGYILGIASGRPLWQNLKTHYKDWGLSFQFDFLLGLNGGEIWFKDEDKTIIDNPLSCEQLQHIVTTLIDEKDTCPFVYRDGMELSLHITQEMVESGKRHNCIIQGVKDKSELWEQETGKILYRCDSDEVALALEQKCKKLFPELASFRTGPELVEIQNKNVSKLSGLKIACKKFNVSLDNVIAFGDAENDIEMIKGAGYGVAVNNAMNSVKAIARDVTKYPAWQEGVGHYLWDVVIDK